MQFTQNEVQVKTYTSILHPGAASDVCYWYFVREWERERERA